MAIKVLVIDDSSTVRRQVCAAVSAGGFQMLEAIDGIDGAEQIRAHLDLALVICDVNMPRMNGLDMLESLQAEIAQRRLPVMMLTTEGQPEAMARAKQLGAKTWLVKPCKNQLLLGAVQKRTHDHDGHRLSSGTLDVPICAPLIDRAQGRSERRSPLPSGAHHGHEHIVELGSRRHRVGT